MELIITIALVVLSIIFHEVAHGYMADALGDPTARYAGRLTVNPLPHVDPIGSVLIPGILALTHSPFLIGWAKPVPYNPYNLRNRRWGEALVGFAGPLTNILIAVVFGLCLRFFGDFFSESTLKIIISLVYTNLVLAIFNLIPIPPLDGSKILASILPYRLLLGYRNIEGLIYALGPLGLIGAGLLAVYVLWPLLGGVVEWLFRLIVLA
jgi:Zn-dependent protease